MPKRTADDGAAKAKREPRESQPARIEGGDELPLRSRTRPAGARPERRPATRAATPAPPLPPGSGPGARIRSAAAAPVAAAPVAVVPKHPRGRLAAVVSLFVLLASAGMGGYALMAGGLFRVQRVNVVGATYVDAGEIARASGAQSQDIFRIKPQDIRERVERVSGVRRAEVHRRWPRSLTVVVEERVPAAVWQVGGVSYAVDREGVVLDFAPDSSLLMITQVDGARSLAPGDRVDGDAVVLAERVRHEAPAATGQRVVKFEWTQAAGLEVTAERGVRVRLGDSGGLEYKFAVWSGIIEQARKSGTPVTEIDLRFGDRVYFR